MFSSLQTFAPAHRRLLGSAACLPRRRAIADMVLTFDPETGFPPPGRVRVPFDEAEALLVEEPAFAESSTRRDLWEGLEKYIARFVALEEAHEEHLGGRHLLHYLWLGGSFVSTELNPRNIDLTVCVDGAVRGALRGKDGAPWLTEAFSRESIKRKFGLSPIEMLHYPVASVFQPDTLEEHERTYLQRRGGWDDWWQRCRLTGEGAPRHPTVESSVARRGYVEVTL